MKKTVKNMGLLLSCVIIATAFWYLCALLYLQWDHRRRPNRRAEITYQTATAVFDSLERFPVWIVDVTRHAPRAGVSGEERITVGQAHIIALITYGVFLYAATQTITVLVRRRCRNGT